MSRVAVTGRLAFELPASLEAGAPPEARGLTRDGVRLMVAERRTGRIRHSTFALLATFLEPGDLVVINTSATLPAAVDATDPVTGRRSVVHLSTGLEGDRWVVEPRWPVGARSGGTGTGSGGPGPGGTGTGGPGPGDSGSAGTGSGSVSGVQTGRWPAEAGDPPSRLTLGAGGARMHLLGRYRDSDRLWVARLELPGPVLSWLAANGRPIRYGYAARPWPLGSYQNTYATEPGSAEMPSAGRPFTPELITRLVAKGVGVAPVVLHTGVASLEADELPYPERVRVPAATAALVNATRSAGGRVVAVGTTSVRALESAFDRATAAVGAFDGWTDLVVTPERGVAVVDGLLTGWHEPEASHLLMLEAVAGRPLLEASYEAALTEGYLWHEFGDVHLILP